MTQTQTEKPPIRKKHRKKFNKRFLVTIAVICLAVGLWMHHGDKPTPEDHVPPSTPTISQGTPKPPEMRPGVIESSVPEKPSFQEAVSVFAQTYDLSLDDWPDRLIEAAEKNPELETFALNYPIRKDNHPAIDLSSINLDEVPLLLQWDERWGYTEYSAGLFGLTGCGPTSLSMVTMYLLQDPSYDPLFMSQFSKENGYSVDGNGTAWALMSEGARKLGLQVTELPLVESKVLHHLEAGHPIICIMGPGIFTTGGHYIVMSGCEDGKIRINDPNSPSKSAMLWEFDQIQDQIRNLWAFQ